jgi:hypothetical protein
MIASKLDGHAANFGAVHKSTKVGDNRDNTHLNRVQFENRSPARLGPDNESAIPCL